MDEDCELISGHDLDANVKRKSMILPDSWKSASEMVIGIERLRCISLVCSGQYYSIVQEEVHSHPMKSREVGGDCCCCTQGKLDEIDNERRGRSGWYSF